MSLATPALADDSAALRADLDRLRDETRSLRERVDRAEPLAARMSGWLDVGFFATQGDGSGIRADNGNRVFPEYASTLPGGAWVFMGDPLSTAINARGDPADTGPSRAVTFDAVHSRGHSSFIANEIGMQLLAGTGDVVALGQFALVPRGRDVSDPHGLFLGDYLDVKLAYADWSVPLRALSLDVYAGKIDSALGIEYREQDAPDRMTVTPSLICRYTCGRPLGVKARARLLGDALAVALAVTNGSHFSEGFPLYDETDSNGGKTAAGRVSWRFPVGAGLELGASGAYGAQDRQPSDAVRQHHVGGDARIEWRSWEIAAEYVRGRAEGKTSPGGPPCDVAQCLRYQGAYALAGWRATNWLMPYLRVDWRDALHESGANFVYVSTLARATAGLRLELGTSVIVKAEYTFNRELGRLPQIPNDVFTSSLIAKF